MESCGQYVKHLWIRFLLFYQPRLPLSYSAQWILIFYCYRLKEIYGVEEWEYLNLINSLQLLLSLVSCSSLVYQSILISRRVTHQYHFSRFQVVLLIFMSFMSFSLWIWRGVRKPRSKPRKSCVTSARSQSTFVNLAVFEVN